MKPIPNTAFRTPGVPWCRDFDFFESGLGKENVPVFPPPPSSDGLSSAHGVPRVPRSLPPALGKRAESLVHEVYPLLRRIFHRLCTMIMGGVVCLSLLAMRIPRRSPQPRRRSGFFMWESDMAGPSDASCNRMVEVGV